MGSLEVSFAPRPSDDDPRRVRLFAMLDLCLPKTDSGDKRRLVLSEYLVGDTTSDIMTLHALPGIMVNKWLVACKFAETLYPCGITIFPRQRWISPLDSVQGYTLLTLHNLLGRAVLQWLQVLSGRQSPPLVIASQSNEVHNWQVSDSESDAAVQVLSLIPI